MPTYVYECAKCGDEFEIWQSITDVPLKRHSGSCRGKLSKVIQPAGIVLKGSGFYKNDSRNGSKRTKVGSSDSTSTTNGSGDRAATESGSSDSSSTSGSGNSSPSSGDSSPSSGSAGTSDGRSGSSSPKKPAKTSSS